MGEETPEQKWKRVQVKIQNAILIAYPNPKRRDCPGADALRDIATRSIKSVLSLDDDPNWEHVTHCSPCYCKYLELVEIRSDKTASNC